VRRAAIALACLAVFMPGPVVANCGVLALGTGHVGAGGFRFGPWAGVEDRGGFGVLRIDACGGREAGTGSPGWWTVQADGLGLPSRRFRLAIGEHDRFRLAFVGDRIAEPRAQVATPMRVAPDGRFVVATPWTAASTTAGMVRLLPSLGEAHLGTTRRRSALAASLGLPDDWDLLIDAREDRISGARAFGAMIGSTGGNSRAVLLPAPVDETIRRVDAALVWSGGAHQFRAGWHLSWFDNAIDAIRWQNPFGAVAGWSAAAAFPGGEGQASTAPDSTLHRLDLAWSGQLAGHLRASASLAHGRATQDQVFLPHTINPTLAATIIEPLPRASLEGRVDSTQATFRLLSRPLDGWRWGLAWRFDERDDGTPRAIWNTIGGDSQAQATDTASNRRRVNQPLDYRSNRIDLDAARRVGAWSTELGARFETVERHLAVRTRTDEAAVLAGLRGDIADGLALAFRVEVADRDGSAYVGNRTFLASYLPAYTSTVWGEFENLPDLRLYPVADRRRHRTTLALDWRPDDRLGLSLAGGLTDDDYRASTLGLTASRIADLHLVLDGTLREGTSWRAFAGHDRYAIDQAGRQFSGGAVRPTQAVDPNRNWFARHRDRANTAGLGFGHHFADQRLRLDAELAASWVRSRVEVRTGSALSAAPLPDNRATLRQGDIRGTWRANPSLDVGLGFRVEDFDGRDVQRDGTAPNTLANVILLGDDSPDYRARVFYVTLAWRY
jgi:MtrB/PioB family decaheme-associated outer membrane protein